MHSPIEGRGLACKCVLQCAVMCKSVLQCARERVLQWCRNVLQCVVVCCSVLQRVAACVSEGTWP